MCYCLPVVYCRVHYSGSAVVEPCLLECPDRREPPHTTRFIITTGNGLAGSGRRFAYQRRPPARRVRAAVGALSDGLASVVLQEFLCELDPGFVVHEFQNSLSQLSTILKHMTQRRRGHRSGSEEFLNASPFTR